MLGQSDESYAPDRKSANELRDQLVASIKAITSYASFEYDAETKSYKATEEVFIASLKASTTDISLKFADGKLVEISYVISFVQDGISMTGTSVTTLSDYGRVVLNP